MAPSPPAAPSRCPVADFVALTAIAKSRAEHALDRFDLAQVADWRGGRMRIEMTNLARRNPCLGDRDLHGPARTVAVLRTGRDVVRIRGRAVADELGERFCAARQRMAQFLDHQDAGAFAHDEAVPRHVEGARGLGRRCH